MALNISAIAAATTELERIAVAAQAGDSAAIAAAVAAAQESDQAALDAATGPLTNAVASLTAEFPPATATLTVSPSTASFTAGAPGSVPLSITGGQSPFTASNLPAGVTFDGVSALVADGSQTAGTTSVTISDSASPALTASVSVVVA